MSARFIAVAEDCDEDFDTVLDAAQHSVMRLPILRARSGSDCLQLLRGGAGRRETLPLLVLLDLNMPGDDGRDVLREIHSDEALWALPVIVLSTSANPRDLHFCYRHGANAYHVKPVDHVLHLQVLQNIFDYWLRSAVLPT